MGRWNACGLLTPTHPPTHPPTHTHRLIKAFHAAAKADDVAMLTHLLSSSPSSSLLLNIQGDGGHTALHVAARAGKARSLAWLLEKGASVLVTDT